MSITYFPLKCSYVQASPPHPLNTQYKVSIGWEKWQDKNTLVSKVQVVYNGKVSGRKSPSYPFGTDDYKIVSMELTRMLDEFRSESKEWNVNSFDKVMS